MTKTTTDIRDKTQPCQLSPHNSYYRIWIISAVAANQTLTGPGARVQSVILVNLC
jgi:hypothetical protein